MLCQQSPQLLTLLLCGCEVTGEERTHLLQGLPLLLHHCSLHSCGVLRHCKLLLTRCKLLLALCQRLTQFWYLKVALLQLCLLIFYTLAKQHHLADWDALTVLQQLVCNIRE